jgi:RNA polymerase sigma factor (sigma-70 family)
VPLSAVLPTDEGDDQAVERALAAGDLLGAAPPPRDPEQMIEEGVLRDQIRGVLDDIPPNERQVLELAYYEELSQSEIAHRLGWPLGTVKTRTRRALYRMREALTPILGADVAPPAALAALASDDSAEAIDGPR